MWKPRLSSMMLASAAMSAAASTQEAEAKPAEEQTNDAPITKTPGVSRTVWSPSSDAAFKIPTMQPLKPLEVPVFSQEQRKALSPEERRHLMLMEQQAWNNRVDAARATKAKNLARLLRTPKKRH